MRITIVQGPFLPVSRLSGGAIEKIWFALGKEFARLGHEVVHLSRRYPGLPDEEIVEGVKHLRIPGYAWPGSSIFAKFLDLKFTLRSIKILKTIPKSDIVVTNTFWAPILFNPKVIGRIYVHVARFPKGQARLYRRAAKLQAVSQVIKDALKAHVSIERISVIPNPVPEGISAGLPPDLSQRKNDILYVGRIHPEKGIQILLRAYGSLPIDVKKSWSVSILGPWETEYGGGGLKYLEFLKSSAATFEGNVQFENSIFDIELLYSRMRKSSIFVYPSIAERGEASPLAPLEAMGCGLVTVVSGLKCFADYIRPGENGLTFEHMADDPSKSLCEVLQEIIFDNQRRHEIALSGHRTAGNFSVSEIARLYLDDFASIIT